MMIELKEIKPVGPWRLELLFSDGSAGVHDFGELRSRSGPLTAAFREEGFFERAFIDDGVLTWPNGYDWDTPQLHASMLAAGEIRPRAAAE